MPPAPELDHVFICCSAEAAPEAAALSALGIQEGPPNTHPGQGTACRRFVFGNAYLELVWISDAAEAQAETVRPTRLWERWSRRNEGAACPFAIILRPGGGDAGSGAPFATWAYHPRYLPPELAIEVAVGTPLHEPEIFFLGFARPPAELGRETPEHRLPLRQITRVAVGSPGPTDRSAPAAALETAGLVSFFPADQHLMELGFDGEAAGGRADLRPTMPLVLRW